LNSIIEGPIFDGEGFAGNSLLPIKKENSFKKAVTVLNWLEQKRKACQFLVQTIPFDQLDQWRFKKESGNMVHQSGRYFSIEGIRVSTNFGCVKSWDQPIIYQPEIGILGIIAWKIDGIYHFLMQCKAEPGNPNIIQLAPTVQATVSNYTKVHNGRIPVYLDYFLKETGSNVWIDQLQPGQAARFFQKQNRNMIVEVNGHIKIHDGFCWLSLTQIKELLTVDNTINDEARSVIACLPLKKLYSDLSQKKSGDGFSRDLFGSMHIYGNTQMSWEQVMDWIDEMKKSYRLNTERISIKKLSGWKRNASEIIHQSNDYFSIISVSVHGDSREVSCWTQPLIADSHLGIAGFVVKKIKNVLHFLIQAKVEPGNINIIELAPTVLCAAYESRINRSEKPPFFELFSDVNKDRVKYSAIQSEEGGRFFRVQNKYMIIEVDETELAEIPANYVWMTLGQMMKLVERSHFNIYARSLLAFSILH